MGISTSKSTARAAPYTPATASINAGLTANQNIFTQQQPRLEQMAQTAQNAYNQIAPGAFQTSPYVGAAQGAAQNIFSGGYANNPGAGTYSAIQGGTNPALGNLSALASSTANNPANSYLTNLAGQSGGAGDNVLSGIANGGYSNPSDKYSTAVTGGKYLNAQPSADLYGRVMSADYLTNNPYLDDIVAQTNNGVQTAANRRLAGSGLGSGVSSNFAGVLGKALAENETGIRYTDYNNAANRQLTAAGQSDSVWSGERNRMQDSNSLLSSNYNTGQANALSAAQALSNGTRTDRSNQLGAANSLGSLFNQGQQNQLGAATALGSAFNADSNTKLNAAQAADGQQNASVAQMLQALGLTGGLSDAQYAGVNPALNLLNTSAQLPYTGVNALAGNINSLAGKYGTNTTSTTPSTFDQVKNGVSLASNIASIFSDRRLKTGIKKVGVLADGLGVYDYDYIWGGGRQRGVMADEVARLRPWALGAPVGGFATVNMGAL